VSDDPWPQLAEQFPAGMKLTGTINRLFDRGAIVDLGNGIEGFVPLSQLGIDDLKRPNDAFESGEPLTMKVTRVDVPNHRLILSVKAWLAEQDDIALAEWTSRRNQVRAKIAANPPAEEPSEARPREKVEAVPEE
jgi:small subunit ribosomal protein S1